MPGDRERNELRRAGVQGVMGASRHLPPFLLYVFLTSSILPASTSPSPQLSVTPSKLEQAGRVTIQWGALSSPSVLDWIGLYWPASSPDHEFIGWLNLTDSEGWESGSGQLSVSLSNVQANYQLRLFQAAHNAAPFKVDEVPVPKAGALASATVEFENPNQPQHVHLALTGVKGEMRVMFSTYDALPSEVQYGLAPEQLQESASAEHDTYQQDHMCEAPANTSLGWRSPGWMHDALLKNLQPRAHYYYRVGSEKGGWSAVFSFVTESSTPAETVALVFGDMGVATSYLSYQRLQPEAHLTLSHLLRELDLQGGALQLVSHIGDLSYARGYAWLWDEFMAFIEPLAARVPYHVVIGNHEYNWPTQPWNPPWASYGRDGGGECGVPYSKRFHMPGEARVPTGTSAPATRNVWYSVEVGLVHWVAFSTEHNFLPGSAQYGWLQTDLAAVDRTRTPYVVVQGHRPLYTSNNEARDLGKRQHLQEHLEPLFQRYRVDLALYGHVHKYERTCALSNHTCVAPAADGRHLAPVHAVIGMAGQDWQPEWEPLNSLQPIFPQPKWSMFRAAGFGYARLHATQTALTLTYLANHDGQVHDEVVIPNPLLSAAMKASVGSLVESWDLCLPILVVALVLVMAGAALTAAVWVKGRAQNITHLDHGEHSQQKGWAKVAIQDVP